MYVRHWTRTEALWYAMGRQCPTVSDSSDTSDSQWSSCWEGMQVL